MLIGGWFKLCLVILFQPKRDIKQMLYYANILHICGWFKLHLVISFQPKRDIKRMLENAGKTLRFSAELVSPMPVDRYRRLANWMIMFIFGSYSLQCKLYIQKVGDMSNFFHHQCQNKCSVELVIIITTIIAIKSIKPVKGKKR